MVDAVLFIGLAIVALVELGKRFEVKDIRGIVIILGAAALGALVGVFDVQLGLTNITVAQGITVGLDAVGLHQVARQIG